MALSREFEHERIYNFGVTVLQDYIDLKSKSTWKSPHGQLEEGLASLSHRFTSSTTKYESPDTIREKWCLNILAKLNAAKKSKSLKDYLLALIMIERYAYNAQKNISPVRTFVNWAFSIDDDTRFASFAHMLRHEIVRAINKDPKMKAVIDRYKKILWAKYVDKSSALAKRITRVEETEHQKKIEQILRTLCLFNDRDAISLAHRSIKDFTPYHVAKNTATDDTIKFPTVYEDNHPETFYESYINVKRNSKFILYCGHPQDMELIKKDRPESETLRFKAEKAALTQTKDKGDAEEKEIVVDIKIEFDFDLKEFEDCMKEEVAEMSPPASSASRCHPAQPLARDPAPSPSPSSSSIITATLAQAPGSRPPPVPATSTESKKEQQSPPILSSASPGSVAPSPVPSSTSTFSDTKDDSDSANAMLVEPTSPLFGSGRRPPFLVQPTAARNWLDLSSWNVPNLFSNLTPDTTGRQFFIFAPPQIPPSLQPQHALPQPRPDGKRFGSTAP